MICKNCEYFEVRDEVMYCRKERIYMYNSCQQMTAMRRCGE